MNCTERTTTSVVVMPLHVGSKGLHLNGSGKARLALDFKETMNSL